MLGGFVEKKRLCEYVSRNISIDGFTQMEVVRSHVAYYRDGGCVVLYSCISKGLELDRLSTRISQDGNSFEDKERLGS